MQSPPSAPIAVETPACTLRDHSLSERNTSGTINISKQKKAPAPHRVRMPPSTISPPMPEKATAAVVSRTNAGPTNFADVPVMHPSFSNAARRGKRLGHRVERDQRRASGGLASESNGGNSEVAPPLRCRSATRPCQKDAPLLARPAIRKITNTRAVKINLNARWVREIQATSSRLARLLLSPSSKNP